MTKQSKDLSHKLIELKTEWKTWKKLVEEGTMDSGDIAPIEGGFEGEGNNWSGYAQKHQFRNRSSASGDEFIGKVIDVLNEFGDVIGNLTNQIQEIKEKIETIINETTSKIEEDTERKINEFKEANQELQESFTTKIGYILTETVTELKNTVKNVVTLQETLERQAKITDSLTKKYDYLEEHFFNLKSKLINFLEALALYEDLSLDSEIEKQLENEIEPEETLRKERPRTEEERAMSHFGISKEEWERLSDEEKQDYISKLPPRGSRKNEESEEIEFKNNEENEEIVPEMQKEERIPTEEIPEENTSEIPELNEEGTKLETSETEEKKVTSEKDLFQAINDIFNTEIANQNISGEVHRVPEPKEKI